MSTSGGSEDRQVIPRWRSVRRTLASGECTPSVPSLEPDEEQVELLDRRRQDWQEKRTESFAAEYVATARLLGQTDVEDGALATLRNSGAAYSTFAWLLQSEPEYNSPSISKIQQNQSIHDRPKRRIKELRLDLERDPRNAVAWSELARAHASLGHQEKAKLASVTALQLSPTSRYLLRSSACFFTTIGEPDRAWALLDRAPNANGDPWLLAARLATAKAAGRPPKGIRAARKVLADTNFSARDISELASELGTIELGSSDKQAKRLFNTALIDPTENSLAQVEWASHNLIGLLVPQSELSDPLASEARAIHAGQEGEWADAASNATDWQGDQLFSTNAAMFASHVYAAGLSDWNRSLEAAVIGLIAHPFDGGLLNNAAYALIELGRLDEAIRLLELIDLDTANPETYISACATRGLFAFRSGFPEIGIELYERGILVAHAGHRTDHEAMALIMLAREQFNLDRGAGTKTLARAERSARGLRNKAIQRWLDIVKATAAKNPAR